MERRTEDWAEGLARDEVTPLSIGVICANISRIILQSSYIPYTQPLGDGWLPHFPYYICSYSLSNSYFVEIKNNGRIDLHHNIDASSYFKLVSDFGGSRARSSFLKFVFMNLMLVYKISLVRYIGCDGKKRFEV